MILSDNDLMILEQLTYLDNNVAEAITKAAGLDSEFFINDDCKNKTIGEILSVFTEENLQKLEQIREPIAALEETGVEWASIIRYLKSSDMSKLILTDTLANDHSSSLALCFVENYEDKNAIVAFRGTSGGQEWIDNVGGLNVEDTKIQKEALEYIECLDYDDITVVGHSKGGNKAMYVAVTSDKVSRCVSMDGQGFSPEFIDKYWAEINEKGNIITNYSLSTDYVHVLLFPVPNSQQVYCRGYDSGLFIHDITQHHSPFSFFVKDRHGKLVLDSNGNVQISQVDENESATLLHNFTTFSINNATEEDKEEIVGFLSGLLSLAFGKEDEGEGIENYVLNNMDGLITVLAYLVKYIDEYDLDSDDIDKLLQALKVGSLGKLGGIIDVLIIDGLIGQLTDGDDDFIISNILLPGMDRIANRLVEIYQALEADEIFGIEKIHMPQIEIERDENGNIISISSAGFVEQQGILGTDGFHIDVTSIWNKLNSKIKEIKVTKGTENYQPRTGEIHDFSKKTYDTIMSAIDKMNNLKFDSVFGWRNNVEFEWYAQLDISDAVKGFTRYSENLIQTNDENKKRIEALFDEVSRIDTLNAKKISEQNTIINSISKTLSKN